MAFYIKDENNLLKKVISDSGSSSLIIDSEMSDTSINVVQNNTIKNYVDQKIQDVRTDNAFQKTEIPEPTAELVGKAFQYIGESNETYKKGGFYQCEEYGVSYRWIMLNPEHEVWIGTKNDLDLLSEEEKKKYKILVTTNGEEYLTLMIDSVPTENSNNLISSKAVYNAVSTKVDKEMGRGLSSNDFTDELKNKLLSLNTTMRLMGTRTLYSELPEDAQNGDTYLVGEAPDLIMYVKTEEGWVNSGNGNVNLDDYLTISQPNNIGKFLKVGESGSIEFVTVESTKTDLEGALLKEVYDQDNDGIVDRADVANKLLDADSALPGQVYRCNPITGAVEFSFLPIEQNATRPIPPLTFPHMDLNSPELIELAGETTSLFIQVSEKKNGGTMDKIIDSFESVNGIYKSEYVEVKAGLGCQIRNDFTVTSTEADENNNVLFDLSDFTNILTMIAEVG